MNIAPAAAHPGVPTQVLDNVWTVFAHNINSGATSYIEMPMNLRSVLTGKGLEIIASRFRNLIQAPVTIFEDLDRNVIQIMPSRHDDGHDELIPGARDPKAQTTKKAKVARPANAFILYRQHHHPLLKSQNPDLHNNQISVILGAQWKNENEITKARFIIMAKQLKAKHQLEHPNYQYQPRKPNEKKRRMTQRKKAALAEASNSKPSPSLNIGLEVDDTIPNAFDFMAPVPTFPQTVGGNAMVELGNEELDDETLTAMLEQYNAARPQAFNQIGSIVTRASPPVIYGEPAEEAQEQKNFYNNVDPVMTNELLAAEMEAVMEAKQDVPRAFAHLDPAALEAKFDEEQEYLFNAEVNRMCHWNEEPGFY